MPKYDPTNIEKYSGKTFKTGSGSEFVITEGKIYGRSIEGAQLQYIAAVPDSLYVSFLGIIDNKKSLDTLIKKVGVEPKIGLHLVISFTSECINQKLRAGMITSRIIGID